MEDKKPSRQQQKQEKKKGKRKGLFFKTFLVFSILILVALSIGGLQIYGLMQEAPEMNEETFNFSNSSTVYDQNNQEIVDLNGGEHRKSIKIEEVPSIVRNAFIAIEDIRFESHNGVDLRRIGGAAVSNITDGFGSEGGSTITQQVVKNAILTSEKSIERKIQEVYLALKLEQQYTKDEILEFYLNKIYFGNGAYGIVTAADNYFGKEVKELTIAEAALLAGLPQRPSGYNPYENPELAENRRDIVLSFMYEHGFITEVEYNNALSVTVEDMLIEKGADHSISAAFMDQVFKELEEINEITPSMIYNGGLKIYTTLDPKAQQHVENVLNTNEFITYPDDEFQAGITLIDTKSGEIKAIGGGRNQNAGENRTNYATNIQRSPGSTIKPILSYGPAIEYLKWSTFQQIKDEEMTYKGTDQVIRNFNNQYHGMMSIREALKNSWNIPAVKTFNEVGYERAAQFASNLGISFNDPIYESYALGSFHEGISPLELAGAYSAFGNGGIFHEPHAVRKVVFPDGTEINLKPDPIQAMNDYTAYMITDMLQTVVNEGTGRYAQLEQIEVAGKTGTTNFPEEIKEQLNITEGVPDIWFAGYTTKYTAAVWTGYSQLSEDNYIKTRDDRQIAQHIFREVMQEMSKEGETAAFQKPDSVEEITIDTRTGKRASSWTSSDHIVTELFVSGTSIEDAYSLAKDEWQKKQQRPSRQHNQTNYSERRDKERGSPSIVDEENVNVENKDKQEEKDDKDNKVNEKNDQVETKEEKKEPKEPKEPKESKPEKEQEKKQEKKNDQPAESSNNEDAPKEEKKSEETNETAQQKQEETQQDNGVNGQQLSHEEESDVEEEAD